MLFQLVSRCRATKTKISGFRCDSPVYLFFRYVHNNGKRVPSHNLNNYMYKQEKINDVWIIYTLSDENKKTDEAPIWPFIIKVVQRPQAIAKKFFLAKMCGGR